MSGESEERWTLSGSCVKDKDDVRRQDETEVSPTYCMQGHLGRSSGESSKKPELVAGAAAVCRCRDGVTLIMWPSFKRAGGQCRDVNKGRDDPHRPR